MWVNLVELRDLFSVMVTLRKDLPVLAGLELSADPQDVILMDLQAKLLDLQAKLLDLLVCLEEVRKYLLVWTLWFPSG